MSAAVPARAKLFRHGGSQAVRLPAEFRFEGNDVFVHRDPFTGDVVLSARMGSWDEFFALRAAAGVGADFLVDRGDSPPQKRKTLGG